MSEPIKRGYRVYSARVPLYLINNLCNPQNVPQFIDAFGGREKYYSHENRDIRNKLASYYVQGFNQELEHYSKLVKALEETGDFVNPIMLTYANEPKWYEQKYLPLEYNISGYPMYLERLGGSRYLAACQVNPSMKIKAIVTDWIGSLKTLIPDAIELGDPLDVAKMFGRIDLNSPEQQIVFGDRGCIMTAMDHFHIDKLIDEQKYNHNHQVIIRRQIIQNCIDRVKKEMSC